MSREEAERLARLVDQAVSMYATLRDRARFRAALIGFLLLAGSFLLMVGSLVSDELLRTVSLSGPAVRNWVALLSIALFLVALAELSVGYRSKAERFDDAFRRLTPLKLKLRAELKGAARASVMQRLADEYAQVCTFLPAIPESQFVGLKKAHLGKIKLSKLADLYPSIPLWILRLRLAWEEIRGTKTD
jgi:hypothetical protein